LFALGTGKSGLPADMMLLSTLATEVTALAVLNAVTSAESLRLAPGEWWPSAQEVK
jgi:hypothetical protein